MIVGHDANVRVSSSGVISRVGKKMMDVEDGVSSPVNTVDPFMRVNKFKNASNVTQRDYKSHKSNGVKKTRYSVNESLQFSSH